MTKRIISAFFLLCLSGLMVGCGGSKYSDSIELNHEFARLINEYETSLEKAGSAKDVAAAMNYFADGMEVLGPQMKKMMEKHPELKDKNNVPEELKPSQQKAEEAGKKFAGTFMKIMPFMKDPEVQAAQRRLGTAMKTMM